MIGLKERRRNRALEIEPGDRIVLYLTKRHGSSPASVRVTGELFEDRETIWPGKPGKPDPYPWRFHTEPELVLDERDCVPAEDCQGRPRAHPQVAGRALEARLPGPDPHRLRARRRAAPGSHARGGRRHGMSEATPSSPRPARAQAAPRRLRAAWRELFGEQRLAAIAALGLIVTMFLPWYTQTGFVVSPGGTQKVEDSLIAFQSWGFIEASILLVALAVLLLLFLRGERRAFHLPFGDGIVIAAGGLWVMFLVFYRQVDKPDGSESGVLQDDGRRQLGHLRGVPVRRAAELRGVADPRAPPARAAARRGRPADARASRATRRRSRAARRSRRWRRRLRRTSARPRRSRRTSARRGSCAASGRGGATGSSTGS